MKTQATAFATHANTYRGPEGPELVRYSTRRFLSQSRICERLKTSVRSSIRCFRYKREYIALRQDFRNRSLVCVRSLSSEALHDSLHPRTMTMFPSLGIFCIISSVAFSSLVQREAPISNIHVLPTSFILPSLTASTFQPENTLPSASLPVHPTSPNNGSSKDINPLNVTQVECDIAPGQALTVESCSEARYQLVRWLSGIRSIFISIGEQSEGVYDIYDSLIFLSCE